jgi:hypothetical protein
VVHALLDSSEVDLSEGESRRGDGTLRRGRVVKHISLVARAAGAVFGVSHRRLELLDWREVDLELPDEVVALVVDEDDVELEVAVPRGSECTPTPSEERAPARNPPDWLAS